MWKAHIHAPKLTDVVFEQTADLAVYWSMAGDSHAGCLSALTARSAAAVPDSKAFRTPWEEDGSSTAAASPTATYPGPAGFANARHDTSAPRIGPRRSYPPSECGARLSRFVPGAGEASSRRRDFGRPVRSRSSRPHPPPGEELSVDAPQKPRFAGPWEGRPSYGQSPYLLASRHSSHIGRPAAGSAARARSRAALPASAVHRRRPRPDVPQRVPSKSRRRRPCPARRAGGVRGRAGAVRRRPRARGREGCRRDRGATPGTPAMAPTGRPRRVRSEPAPPIARGSRRGAESRCAIPAQAPPAGAARPRRRGEASLPDGRAETTDARRSQRRARPERRQWRPPFRLGLPRRSPRRSSTDARSHAGRARLVCSEGVLGLPRNLAALDEHPRSVADEEQGVLDDLHAKPAMIARGSLGVPVAPAEGDPVARRCG